MTARRLNLGAWLRLCVTLLAVTCMLARAAMPTPSEARGQSVDLKFLGAALCHSDDGGDSPAPANRPYCDHCPSCTGSFHVTPFLTVEDTIHPPLSLADILPPAGLNTNVPPLAPPARANTPRAPPSV